MSGTVLMLDALFDDLSIESEAAAARGWNIAAWDGTDEALQGAEVIAHVRKRIDAELLDAMPRCRVVARFGTGLDTVDRPAAEARAVTVVGVRDYCVPELTTHTLGLAFALDRHLGGFEQGADWTWQVAASHHALPGRTRATVIGFGTIGAAVTRALLALGMTVTVVTQHGASEAERLGARTAVLDDSLPDADFVFLHCAIDAATTGTMDAGRLRLMAPDAILVNTARLGLLDEAAIAAALEAGQLGGLALDAHLGPTSPLRAMIGDPRFMLTPHIGWYSARSARELRRRTIEAAIDTAEAQQISATQHYARSTT